MVTKAVSAVSFFESIARPLYKRGLHTIPLWPKTKKAIPEKWAKTYCKRLATPEEFDDWCNKYPGANVGIALGHGRFVIDVDNPFELNAFMTDHPDYRFTPTWRVKSGGAAVIEGKAHMHYRDSGVPIKSYTKKNEKSVSPIPGCDILADGHQVVGPGSIHPDTGAPYTVAEDLPIAYAPRWILLLVADHSNPKTEAALEFVRLVEELEAMLRGAGARNNALYRAATYAGEQIANKILVQAEVLARLHDTQKYRDDPAECDATIRSGFEAGAEHAKNPVKRPFELREDGVYYWKKEQAVDAEGKATFNTFAIRLCGWLEVAARAGDSDATSSKIQVRFKDMWGKEWTRLVPSRLTVGTHWDELITLLADWHLDIAADTKEQPRIADYLRKTKPQRKMHEVTAIGWQADYTMALLPDGDREVEVFGTAPAGDGLIYEWPFKSVENPYRHAGTLEEWQEHIGKPSRGNSRIIFAESLAFSAPLQRLLHMQNTTYNLYGTGTKGKTTVARCAGSICGGGLKDGYLKSWRATDNGAEKPLLAHNDMLTVFDEGKLGKKRMEVVRMVASGRTKDRGTTKGGSDPGQTFSTVLLSTSNLKLRRYDAHESFKGDEALSQDAGGDDVRCIEIKALVNESGVFDTTYGVDPAAFADGLAEASHKYYGTPIRKFWRLIAADPKRAVAEVEALRDAILGRLLPPKVSGQVRRVARDIAFRAAAGEYAGRHDCFLPEWREGEAEQAARCIFDTWREERGTDGNIEDEDAVDRVLYFLQANYQSRFVIWGDTTKVIHNIVGYRNIEKNGTHLSCSPARSRLTSAVAAVRARRLIEWKHSDIWRRTGATKTARPSVSAREAPKKNKSVSTTSCRPSLRASTCARKR